MTFNLYLQKALALLVSIFALPALAVDEPIGAFQVEVRASGLNYPWALAELPDGRLLVTEKTGALKLIDQQGQVTKVSGVPDVFVKGQGGLMDLVLHPQYASNGWLYISYAHGNAEANHLRVMRARLQEGRLTESQILFTAMPAKATPVHYGARMAFLGDGSLVIASGDGFDYREQAQNPASHLGKLIRLNDDGSVPPDNPVFSDGADGLYSLGHRNPQGLAWDPIRKRLFANEHGPAGGDEINQIVAGKNYGWPVITQGKDYSGANISPFRDYPGMQHPLVDWTPSVAPSSLVVYRGQMFPELTGDLLSTTLVSHDVRRVVLQQGAVVRQDALFSAIAGRLRDIHIGAQGQLYLLSDGENGKVLEIRR